MQLNSMEKLAHETGRKIKRTFGNRIGGIEIYDVVEVPGHWAFKIRFIAYNYYVLIFNYELDIIGVSIEVGVDKKISLIKEHTCYSDGNLDEYLNRVKEEVELRIPDKYLEAKGWK